MQKNLVILHFIATTRSKRSYWIVNKHYVYTTVGYQEVNIVNKK